MGGLLEETPARNVVVVAAVVAEAAKGKNGYLVVAVAVAETATAEDNGALVAAAKLE